MSDYNNIIIVTVFSQNIRCGCHHIVYLTVHIIDKVPYLSLQTIIIY